MVAHLSIILIEDHDDLRDLTAEALRAEGHRVIALSCAEELEDEAQGERPDVFLVDINLPGEDGFSLSRRLREAHPLVDIIIISARSGLDDKLVAYESGADWYLPKPVPFEELSAALKSFARRRFVSRVQNAPTGLQLIQQELRGTAGSVRLTAAEARLLTAFARAPAGRLESWQLAELLGGDSADFSKASLEVRIVRLRKKLQQAGAAGGAIESIRSVGYQLQCTVSVLA